MNLTISHATLHDIPDLEKLVNEAYRGPVSRQGWTTEADLLTGVRTDEAGLKEMMGKEGAMILKATTGDEGLVGCVYMEKKGKEMYLGMITVSPRIQARGIGKEIMKVAEQEARRMNCDRLTMGVISIRHELIAWYERRGYRPTGVVRPLPVDKKFMIGREVIVLMEMAKSLTAEP